MTLAKCIANQIEKAPVGQSSEIHAVDGELRVALKLADWDRLACLLDRLDLEQSQGGHLPLDADQIEEQITYLGERLGIIETERKREMTILRSVPPRIDGDSISFFEMVLDRSKGLSLLRYKYDRRLGVRKYVPAPLTRETLERLINDLIRLVREN